jgi:hypothetical protein
LVLLCIEGSVYGADAGANAPSPVNNLVNPPDGTLLARLWRNERRKANHAACSNITNLADSQLAPTTEGKTFHRYEA